MQVRESVLVRRSVAEVFDFIADPDSATRWRSHLMGVTGSSAAVGDRMTQTYGFGGRMVRTELEVTEYAPPERLAFKVSEPVHGHIAFHCRSDGDGTRVSVMVSGAAPGVAGLLTGRVMKQAERLIKDDLAKLKVVLEPSA